MARDLGVTEEMPNEYAIALGSSDITIYEMLGAYSSFCKFWKLHKPEMVWRIEDANGRVIKEVKKRNQRSHERNVRLYHDRFNERRYKIRYSFW